MILYPTSTNQKLARSVAKNAHFSIGKVKSTNFADGELFLHADKPRKKSDVIVFGSTHQPDKNLLELMWLINAIKHSSGRKPIVTIPYFGYARQDRSIPPGSAIAAEVIAQTLKAIGARKIITIDIHSKHASSFLKIPHTDLSALPLLIKPLKINRTNTVVIAPDAGAIRRAQAFADLANINSTAVVHKKRPAPGKAVAIRLDGNVDKMDAIIVDDMIDTGGTIIAAAQMLKKHGARSVRVVATHGIFSKGALSKMKSAGVSRVITTNTIPQNKKPPYLNVISVAPIIAKYLKSI